MRDPTEKMPIGPHVSRRTVLGGLMAAAMTPAILTWARADDDDSSGDAAPTSVASGGIETAATPRFLHAAALLPGGDVLVTGGWRHTGLPNYTPPLASAQIFRTATNTWTDAAPMHTGRAQHTAVTLADGKILVAGGLSHVPLASAEIYDPITDTWTPAAPMPESRYGHSAVLAGDRVIVNGGFHLGPVVTVLIYRNGSWAEVR